MFSTPPFGFRLMQPIPLPSHIHYELLLQILERQTIMLANKAPGRHQEQVQELISTLRKAFTQQKNLEENLRQAQLPMEYRWSLNEAEMPVPSREIN